jgi:hypothetical protein
MNRRKLFAAPVLLLTGMLLLSGAASGASTLTSADQIAQVVSPTINNGSFPISSMLRVKGDGQLEPISGPMPENQVFIATRIIGYFIADDPTFTGLATFNLGDYFRMSPYISAGFCTFLDNITPGVPITNLNPTVYLHLEYDSSKAVIPGKLNVRVMGYVTNIN